jgi:type I restriction enzyme S subunit
MSEWKEYKLGDLTSKIGSGSTPRGGSGVYKESGIPFIRSQNILDLKFSDDGLAFIDEVQAKELSNVEVQIGDIFINITGDSVARVCKVPTALIPSRVNQHVAILRSDLQKLESDFLKYSLIQMKEYLLSISEIGGTRRAITKSMLESLPILLPPLAEQKAIAGVLSALDDKIDLLHRQNKTLEAMAEALFRQWFVEEAEESDQQIVKGEEWLELPLSSIANFLNGLACQKYPPTSVMDSLPVLKIKELNSGLNESSDRASKAIPKEYIVNDGDLIFSWSATLMVKIWTGGQCILNQHLFKVTSESYPKWFVYFWCKEHLKEFQSIAQTHATTMGHIKRSDLDKAMVLCPDRQTLTILDSEIDPLMAKFVSNQIQIRSLEKLRDTLLPKLMSGEVRVNE